MAEDGSKPRWLDKSPTAAQVHELHVLQTNSSSFHQRNSSTAATSQMRQINSAGGVGGSAGVNGNNTGNISTASSHFASCETCYSLDHHHRHHPRSDQFLACSSKVTESSFCTDDVNFRLEQKANAQDGFVSGHKLPAYACESDNTVNTVHSMLPPVATSTATSTASSVTAPTNTRVVDMLDMTESVFGVPLTAADNDGQVVASEFLPLTPLMQKQAIPSQTQQQLFDYPNTDCIVLADHLSEGPVHQAKYRWTSNKPTDLSDKINTSSNNSSGGNTNQFPLNQDVPIIFSGAPASTWYSPQPPQLPHITQPAPVTSFSGHSTDLFTPTSAGSDTSSNRGVLNTSQESTTGEQTSICLLSNLQLQNYAQKPDGVHDSVVSTYPLGKMVTAELQSPSQSSYASSGGHMNKPLVEVNFDSEFQHTGVDWLPQLEVHWQENRATQSAFTPSDAVELDRQFSTLSPMTSLPDSAQLQKAVRQEFFPLTANDSEGFLPTASCTEEVQVWLSRMVRAWNSAWKDGIFPNPSSVSLRLDLNATSALKWHLTLANLWADLLLRRVATFAAVIFGFDEIAKPLTHESLIFDHLRNSTDLLESSANKPVISKDSFIWILRNRLVNCVPVILARSLFQPHSTGDIGLQTRPETIAKAPRSLSSKPAGNIVSELIDQDQIDAESRCLPAQISVCFQVPPEQHVFISLSKLSQNLAETRSTLYPSLQYLDSYVCELNKFLAEHAVLHGAFMAIKLTESPSETEKDSSLSTIELTNLQALNGRFRSLFCAAADQVATERADTAGDSSIRSFSDDSLQRVRLREDAVSRRTQLPDFLHWGRKFDSDLRAFLISTCGCIQEHVEVLDDSGVHLISPGLNFFSETNSIPPIMDSSSSSVAACNIKTTTAVSDDFV